MEEQMMILVDEQDNEIGLLPKMATHEQGLLHRAFSIFLFTNEGEMILQQRAANKYHSPNLWTNACCSHPMPNEIIENAATRRLKEELGIEVNMQKIFSFVYKADMDNGLIEHEYDHVFIGEYDTEIPFNTEEVASIKNISLQQLEISINQNPEEYTAWFLIAYPQLKNWMAQNIKS
jgi:isopentenyl-diphosphate Delta-isomerase